MAKNRIGSNAKHRNDNRSRQLNPEHDAYWRSRGEPGRPAPDGSQPPANDGAARPGGR